MDQTWTRPYPTGPGRWLVIAWEAGALAMLAWATISQFELTGHGVKLVSCAIAALWVLGAYRILQMGAYVGASGLRIHGLLRSQTTHWRDIANVRLHRATQRVGPWRIETGTTVLLERHDGRVLNTELWSQGIDFHAKPSLFRAVYHDLRTRHQQAQTSQ